MKRMILAALIGGVTLAHAQTPPAPAVPATPAAPAPAPVSPAKKELVAKLLALQQQGIENLARGMVEQPAAQMMQEAGRALQAQVPADKREAVGKSIEADVRKYVEEATPLVRERALKVAPATIGATFEEKFSEDELKQLIAWFDSPVNKKFLQVGPEMQNNFMQKLATEARPQIDPKLQALAQKVRTALGVSSGDAATPAPATGAATKPAAKAPAPAKAASK